MSGLQTGLDVFIANGPELTAISRTLLHLLALPPDALVPPGRDIERLLVAMQHNRWVTIEPFTSGEFGFKVEVLGAVSFDGAAFAEQLSARLSTTIAVPDEGALDPYGCIVFHPNGDRTTGLLSDDGRGGFKIERPIEK